MGRRATLILTALLAIMTVLCLIIYLGVLKRTGDDPRPDYTSMDKAELSALILVNPDWHEPRARLAQLLLEEGKAVAALEHILVLAWGDWDVSDLQQNLSP